MRLLILAAMALLTLPSAARPEDVDQPEALSKSCPKGVLFKELRSGIVVTVVRQGQGKAVFTEDKHRLQAATAAEILTKEGEHGFICGPMRSYMFAVDPGVVKGTVRISVCVAGIMGEKESHYVTTQGAGDSG